MLRPLDRLPLQSPDRSSHNITPSLSPNPWEDYLLLASLIIFPPAIGSRIGMHLSDTTLFSRVKTNLCYKLLI